VHRACITLLAESLKSGVYFLEKWHFKNCQNSTNYSYKKFKKGDIDRKYINQNHNFTKELHSTYVASYDTKKLAKVAHYGCKMAFWRILLISVFSIIFEKWAIFILLSTHYSILFSHMFVLCTYIPIIFFIARSPPPAPSLSTLSVIQLLFERRQTTFGIIIFKLVTNSDKNNWWQLFSRTSCCLNVLHNGITLYS